MQKNKCFFFHRQTFSCQVYRWHSFRKICLLAFFLSASHGICAYSLPCRLASEPMQHQILQAETMHPDEVPQKVFVRKQFDMSSIKGKNKDANVASVMTDESSINIVASQRSNVMKQIC